MCAATIQRGIVAVPKFTTGHGIMRASPLILEGRGSARLLVTFVGFWVSSNAFADVLKIYDTHASLVITEAVKLVLSIAASVWCRNRKHNFYQEVSLSEPYQLEPSASTSSTIIHKAWFCAPIVASLYVIRNYWAIELRKHADPFSLSLALPITTLCSMFLTRLCFSRGFNAFQYHAAVLLFCGMCFIQASVAIYPLSQALYPSLPAFAVLNSMTLVLTDYMYKFDTSSSPHALNVVLFACGFIVQTGVLFTRYVSGTMPGISTLAAGHPALVVLLPLGAFRDLASLNVISRFDAAVETVITSISLSVLLLGMATFSLLPFIGVWGGCLLVLVASASYLWHQDKRDANPGNKKVLAFFTFLLAFVAVAAIAFHTPDLPLHPRSLSSFTGVFSTARIHPVCLRKPSVQHLKRSPRYHEFDNVLLVVFFSHARRYGANLDYYKEVYSEYFPNIVFVGPNNREDLGFSHSYDVLVDSYQSDENLTDFKMAGRMAHHLLYTALKEHDCGYDGYLFAPFDTLLNIPRLQKFDKDRFWYHSPWGEYVPNPALGSFDLSQNRHAPPAKISPDPPVEVTPGYMKNWWWGDPDVGLPVCWGPFKKVPVQMRERLSSFTGGELRLLGGSADTVYIPNRHRDAFMEILAIFLETDCFLEIAVPTTLHLVLPPGENVLFVDHWWIWRPPFNATFVRKKWEEGFEVDSFHTFHWGETGADGVWRPIRGNVDDVRLLLQESARRQNIRLP